jgi:hypothetical protein
MAATDTTWLRLEAFGELTAVGRAGGQGRVHRPECSPAELGAEPLVVKLYRRPPAPPVGTILAEMVRWERTLSPDARARLARSAAWPVAVVVSERRVVGIVMRDVTESFAVPFLMPSGRRDPVLLALEHLLGPDGFLRNRGLDVTLDTATRARVAERISGALAFLHQHAIAVGDVAPSNVLVAFRPAGVEVRLIDCDSMVFRGACALAPVETGDWNLPPEFGEASGTRAADAYKLGLVVLRLFARSHDARTIAPHLRQLPAPIRDLLHRALSSDAVNRPPAGEWERALHGLGSDGTLNASHPGPRAAPGPPPVAPGPPPAQVTAAGRAAGRGAAVGRAAVGRGALGRAAAGGAAAPAAVATGSAARGPAAVWLRRIVILLWLLALALAAGAVISRLDRSPGRPAPTTFYPQGPGGRVFPSVGQGR